MGGTSDDLAAEALPNPLAQSDGTPITTTAQWESRRPELLALLTREMYGRAPEKPARMTVAVTDDEPSALNGLATRRQITVRFAGDAADGPQMEVLLYIPNTSTAPVPAFVGLNFGGNQTVSDDPAIHAPEGEARRGSDASRWPLETILARGYALATVYYHEIARDDPAAFRGSGATALFPDLLTGGDNAAGIGVWAWGLSRILDYLETDAAIDAHRVIAFGHSRLGKAALWAGATDPRFALVISNESGAGGAKLFRRPVGENIRRLNTVFPHWFNENFKRYTDRDTNLPWDQHWVLALIAPRPLYIASAIEDTNADPEGEFAGARAADPVYRLLTGDGLSPSDFPALNHPLVGGRIGYHVRSGKHDVTDYDWEQYLNFADRHLSAKK